MDSQLSVLSDSSGFQSASKSCLSSEFSLSIPCVNVSFSFNFPAIMSSIPNPVIRPGSWILVTGVNGFIGSHIADQLLLAGYKVRGTVRSVPKNAWMAEFFESKYGKDVFELIEVGDMSQEGSLDDAMKGILLLQTPQSKTEHQLSACW